MTMEPDFLRILQPEKTTDNSFQGISMPFDSPSIYGGQLMAQVLSVAADTLDEPRPAHYLQTSFVAFGDPKAPLQFEVIRTRDGRSTSHRHVEVKQEERTLLLASISFQTAVDGFDHQKEMPEVPRPSALESDPANYISFAAPDGDFPFLILNCPDIAAPGEPVASIWAKPRAHAPAGHLLHQMLFAFLSDATILQSALVPHNLDWEESDIFVATMNHSIWFHRAVDINNWLLLHGESPSTSQGRALSIANAFSASDQLIATVAQEGTLRSKSA